MPGQLPTFCYGLAVRLLRIDVDLILKIILVIDEMKGVEILVQLGGKDYVVSYCTFYQLSSYKFLKLCDSPLGATPWPYQS